MCTSPASTAPSSPPRPRRDLASQHGASAADGPISAGMYLSSYGSSRGNAAALSASVHGPRAPQPEPPAPAAASSLGAAPLSADEHAIFTTLDRLVADRRARGQGPTALAVVTDIAKDYDDLCALVVLKALHHLEVVELRCVVANLMPQDKRARFARGALDTLGLCQVPVGIGSAGSPEHHVEHDYEFDCGFMAGDTAPIEDGHDLLLRTYQDAAKAGEKLSLVCLSSLRDVCAFSGAHPELVTACTQEVHMQGDCSVTAAGDLEACPKAANNRFDYPSAQRWHAFVQQHAIQTFTYTKVAAYASALSTSVFDALADTRHPVGMHLQRVQRSQDVQFYRGACDPATRFMPHLDQEWFLRNRSSWYQDRPSPQAPAPQGEEIVPYLTQVVVYDALAALGSAGQDIVEALGVFAGEHSHTTSPAGVATHTRYGSPTHSGIHPSALKLTLQALLKGSLFSPDTAP